MPALIAALLSTTLVADPAHSTAGFAVKHMMVTTVRGQFTKFTSSLDWNDQDPSKSSVTADIDAASIDTHNADRDKHLKGPDFFDVAKCPKISFKSNSVEKAGGDRYKVNGELTMHCVTKPVTLEATTTGKPQKNPWGMAVYGVSATATVNRSDFGLTWNKAIEGGGVLVSDKVEIELSLEYGPKPEAKTQPAKAEAASSTPAKKK